jgi:hypothetical protein
MSNIQLLDAASHGMATGSIVVGFICIRSILEHVAQLNSLLSQLRSYEVPSNWRDADELLKRKIDLDIAAVAYATRVDWSALVVGDAEDLLNRDKVEYKPQENRINRTAASVLKSIDKLGKSIKGIAGVYDLLCEFAHPNAGLVLGFARSMNHHEDAYGVHWVRKNLSLQPPIGTVEANKPIFRKIFSVLAESLAHLEKLLDEAQREREKILQITQIVVRQTLDSRRDLIIPYSPCPCGSGRKTKFCCSAKGKK